MGFTPETNITYEPLPEGDYPFVVVAPDEWLVEMPDWKKEYVLAAMNERAKENGKDGIESIDDLPAHKVLQIKVPLKVREGEYEGRYLPTLYLSARFNTDPKYMEKSNWYKFLKAIVPNLKERAAKGDVPDFDKEVVGYGGIAEVEVTDKGRNKVVSYRKDKTFGTRLITEVEAAVASLGATVKDFDDDSPDIPF